MDHIYYGATMQDALKYGDFDGSDILEELRKDPKDRRIKFTEFMPPEAMEIWKNFSQMSDRTRY